MPANAYELRLRMQLPDIAGHTQGDSKGDGRGSRKVGGVYAAAGSGQRQPQDETMHCSICWAAYLP